MTVVSGTQKAVYVKLMNTVEDPPADGVLRQGSLLFKARCDDPWGRICHYSTNETARVFCRILGFPEG